MTADQRLTAAREFLAGTRKRKVDQLPPSVLMREDAELRRQLGQVLDVSRESVSLTDDQLVTLSQALADALNWRTPEGWCPECEASPSNLCGDHADDLDKTDSYLHLAAELGLELDG